MIFTSRDTFFKDPFGAVAAGEPVTLRLLLPASYADPALEVFADDDFVTPAHTLPMQSMGPKEQDILWEVVFAPPKTELLFYRFSAQNGLMRIGQGEHGVGELGSDDLWQLTVYDPDFFTPPEYCGGVFYQIFPDRFCASGAPRPECPGDRILHSHWNEDPVNRPDQNGKFLCNDYFGGDLTGIREKLPYIASLGVGAIYLNPIFEAHSNHRYNTADYLRVDPLLGTRQDFCDLCAAAHKLDIRVILDGVFNHTGSDSLYFNREKRYGDQVGACNDPDSPYREWFSWIDYPTSYRSWWGFETLPDLNEGCESYREFICGENGVIRSWLRAGADGFRLDVADELPDEFIADIRTALKAEKPEGILIGEVWEDASNKQSYGVRRRYFQGQELDSVMNYSWRYAILSFMRYGGGLELLEALTILMENYPPQVLAVTLNLLSSHDVPRAITAIAAQPAEGRDRDWQRAHNTMSPQMFYSGRQLFLLAAMLQYTLPGCPCLYYGDEAGLVGYADPFNRGTYPWGSEDQGMVDFFCLLGGLRKGLTPLRIGRFVPVRFDQHAVTFLRECGDERILVSINRSASGYKIPFDPQALAAGDTLLTAGGILGPDMLYGHSGAIIRLAPAKAQE